MQVVMIDRKNIIINPDNRKIYRIGDVSRLKEDIKTNGIRQPLEVVELDDGNYKLIGGERRLTACEELAREGDTRFEALPCVILKLKYDDDEKIALITANATARDLTDGERLAQYETLKEILTRRKSLGGLSGKVRDELCRILGLSTGAAARLNAISENCGDDTKRELQAGEITLMGAYRRAQEIIAERMAQQESAKALKPDKPVHEKPVVFDCKPESSVTVPKQSPESHCTPQNIPAGYEPKATESHGLPEKPEESRGKDTLRKLAEKELSQKALWTFDRNLFIYQLDFYKHSLPGGAELYRMEDRQKDEHKRYAIILQDYEFFTSGWESYEEAVESLVRYLSLK
jgi:ParB-like chromosome segregation protein Spo0J